MRFTVHRLFWAWLPQWEEAAKRAVAGRYLENGRISEKLRRKGLKPETRYRPDES
jgi:4-hydroxy-3-polyprenylbenzoate decarboxylase